MLLTSAAACSGRRLPTTVGSSIFVAKALSAPSAFTPPPLRRISRTRLCERRSVSGEVYAASEADAPVVKLFTKEGCTLCDKVKDVLQQCSGDEPHTLLAVDITDADKRDWWDRYKYDIPVLHVNDAYWTKHGLTEPDAVEALRAAREGTFTSPRGEPNAAKYEK